MQTQYMEIENRKEHDENMMENVQVKQVKYKKHGGKADVSK